VSPGPHLDMHLSWLFDVGTVSIDATSYVANFEEAETQKE
jgi:hypothetical protein